MINLSILSKKEILNFLNKSNNFLTNKLNNLEFKSFKELYSKLIYDRRLIITIVIVILSVFAHLSTPAFYQDKWVLNKIKKQLENEFDITFLLPNEVNYSMFPVPSFYLKNVGFAQDGRKFGQIEQMKINLSYNKFFDKEKVNIQNIYIKNSKIEIYREDLNNLFDFFDKEINNKKLFINDSKIFLKDKYDDVYLILALKNSVSYFDKKKLNNILNLKGDIFNNKLKAKVSNNYLTKKTNMSLEFKEIGKKVNLDLDYLFNQKSIKTEIIDGSKSFLTDIEFNKNKLTFRSSKKNVDGLIYNGTIIFEPFSSNINVDIKSFDLSNLVDNGSFFLQIINSEIISNPNLNYKFKLRSKNLTNHRLFKDLILCISYDQKNFNLNDTKLIFDDNVEINISESKYFTNENGNFFIGKINFKIKDDKKLYKYFQTRREFRKPLDNIDLVIKYNLKNSTIFIEKIALNKKINEDLNNIIKKYQNKIYKNFRRIEIKKIFNDIVSAL